MEQKAGYSQQELINSLSILAEMKKMAELYCIEAQLRLEEPTTEETQRLILRLAEITGRMSQTISKVLGETAKRFDELILVKELIGE